MIGVHVRGANGREDWGYGDWAVVMEMSRVGTWLGERVAIERGDIIIAVTDAAIQLSTPAQPSPSPPPRSSSNKQKLPMLMLIQ